MMRALILAGLLFAAAPASHAADGKWIVAMQDDGQGRGPSGLPLFQIVVFPR